MSRMTSRRAGFEAALRGMATLTALDPIEHMLLARRPTYHRTNIAGRLLARGGLTSPLGQAAAGVAFQAAYSLALGQATTFVGRLIRSRLLRGLSLGAAVLGAELLVLPLVGATPPVRSWPRRDVALLALHTTAFGVAAASISRGV